MKKVQNEVVMTSSPDKHRRKALVVVLRPTLHSAGPSPFSGPGLEMRRNSVNVSHGALNSRTSLVSVAVN